MRLTDSHCHLTDDAFGKDRQAVVARARDAGVERIVSVASDLEDAAAALELARAHEGVWSTAGVHPHAVTSAGLGAADPRDARAALDTLREALAHPRCVAVGETGLDYHYDHAPRDAQRRSFLRHAEVAGATGLPLVVHSREAAEDTAAVIRECAGAATGVLHCFTGPPALMETALDAGWLVSFTGTVTFPWFDAGLVRAVPPGRWMIETDSPYLAPVPRRGRRNEPAFVRHVAEAVARLRDEPAAQVAADTWNTASRFFGLPEAPSPFAPSQEALA